MCAYIESGVTLKVRLKNKEILVYCVLSVTYSVQTFSLLIKLATLCPEDIHYVCYTVLLNLFK